MCCSFGDVSITNVDGAVHVFIFDSVVGIYSSRWTSLYSRLVFPVLSRHSPLVCDDRGGFACTWLHLTLLDAVHSHKKQKESQSDGQETSERSRQERRRSLQQSWWMFRYVRTGWMCWIWGAKQDMKPVP